MNRSTNYLKKANLLLPVIFILFFIETPLNAQQDSLIFRYRKMAVEYQQQVKIAETKYKGAESMVELAKSDYLPKLDFYGRYMYYGEAL